MIDKLCTECSALIENHEKIQILSAVHYNLGKTLQVSPEQYAGNASRSAVKALLSRLSKLPRLCFQGLHHDQLSRLSCQGFAVKALVLLSNSAIFAHLLHTM